MAPVLRFPPSKPTPASEASAATEAVLNAIRLLLNTLLLEEQRRVLDELAAEIQPITTPRAGEVLGKIVQWMPRDSEWTVEDAKRGLTALGGSASPKEVYNAISYLNRRKHIRRVGYGRYIVDGAELVTIDDLGVEPARYED